MKKNYFEKSQKFAIREIRKIPYENPTFFHGQALTIHFFALHSHYTDYTQYRVWIDLDRSLTRWKGIIFKILENSQFTKFAKFRMKTNFFPRQFIPTIFSLCTLITLLILHTEFGFIWTTPWPDEKELFLNFSKIRNSRNSQNSVWKPNFFPKQALQIFSCFTLSLH